MRYLIAQECVGGALSSGYYQLKEQSAVNGVSWKEYGKRLGIGVFSGAIAAVVSAVIAAGAAAVVTKSITSGFSETVVKPIAAITSNAVGGV